MSVSDTDVKAIYQGNGATTAFAIPFALQSGDITHIKVYLRDETDEDAITETLKTITTHYTLDSATSPTTVTMLTAPASDEKLIIIRESPLTQQVSYSNNSAFLATDHEKALDRLAYQIQCLDEALDRSLKIAVGDPTNVNMTMAPNTNANRAGCGLFFDDEGDRVVLGPTADTVEAAEGYAVAAAASASAASSSASAASASASAASSSASAAAASAVTAAASVTPNVSGTRGSPNAIAGSGSITVADSRICVSFITGSGGAVTGVTIANATSIGDRIILIGCSDTNTVKMTGSGTLILRDGGSEKYFYSDTVGHFIYIASGTWMEI